MRHSWTVGSGTAPPLMPVHAAYASRGMRLGPPARRGSLESLATVTCGANAPPLPTPPTCRPLRSIASRAAAATSRSAARPASSRKPRKSTWAGTLP